jgi:polar amino acid transport system substrate-binding protein
MLTVFSRIGAYAFWGAFLLVLAGAQRLPAQNADASLALRGELRVAVIGPDPGLVTRAVDGKLSGVLIELADALGATLGSTSRPVLYDNRTRFNLSLGKDDWDIALVPRDLSRIEQLAFSDVLLEVDYGYLARGGSLLRAAQDVDRAGVKVGVTQGSFVDGFLTRSITRAEIVRLFSSLDTVATEQALNFRRIDVYADSTHVLYRMIPQVPGSTVLTGRFTMVPIAAAVPKKDAPDMLPLVNDFVQEARKKGLIAEAIKHASISGVRPGR